MHRLIQLITLIALCAEPALASATAGDKILGTILGKVGRKAQRQQQQLLLGHLQPFWRACGDGDVVACSAAAHFPLNPQGRSALKDMQNAAERRPTFLRDLAACKKANIAACDAALGYPYASQHQRSALLGWRQQAVAQHRAIVARRERLRRMRAAFQQLRESCRAGAIAACSQALPFQHADAHALASLRLKRQQLLVAGRERHSDRLRADQALRHNCRSGQWPACTSTLAHEISLRQGFIILENQQPELIIAAQRAVAPVQRIEGSGIDIVHYVVLGIVLTVVFVGSQTIVRGSFRRARTATRTADHVARTFPPAGPIVLSQFGQSWS